MGLVPHFGQGHLAMCKVGLPILCLLRRSKVRSEVLESREGAGKKYCEMGQGREMLTKNR